MKSVIVRLQEHQKQVSGAEKGIVSFLLSNPEAITQMTIHTLATNTYTSASTVVRLCRKLGFSGFREFHQSLVYELALVESDYKEKSKDITREDSLKDIVEKVTVKNILSLENTAKLMDLDILCQSVHHITQAKNIYLFGMGASLLVARDAYLKFLRVNKPVIFNEDWHLQMIQAKNTTEQDVAIAISYSGLTEEVLRCIAVAKENKATVIAITRFEDNPLAKMADYNLSVAATEFIFRSGAMSSRIAQLNVIDILYTAFVNQYYDESLIQFKKTHISKEEENLFESKIK